MSTAPAPGGSTAAPPPQAATASPPPSPAVAASPPLPATAPPPAAPVTPSPPVVASPPPAVASPPPVVVPGGGGTTPSPPVVNPTPPAGGTTPSPPATGTSPSPPAPSNPSTTPSNPSTDPSTVPTSRSPPSRTPSAPKSSSLGSNNSSGVSSPLIIGAAVGGVVILALLLGLFVFCCRRRPKRRYRPQGYEAGEYKPELYEHGRRPEYGAPVKPHHPPPPPPPPPHKHHAYGSPKPKPPPPPPPPPPQAYGYASSHFDSSGSQNSWKPVPPPPPPGMSPSLGNSRSWFTYDELEAATDGFSRNNLLGEGGFGFVYKGQLPNGKVVAVKQLKAGSGQGEREFRAEVETISRVHHRHLVSLVGYCIADSQRLLVYDYVPNGTLEQHLHGKGRPVMEWSTRLKVAAGAARGLAYLHEDCHPRIIHRDIKSSNILLDNNFEAQVSDFGLAKLASDTYTHVTTRVMGTFGYLAPEYASTGKLTDKSDVFSFGVVLLEMVTGRKPVDTSLPVGSESLVEWARPILNQAFEEGNLDAIVDKRLPDYNETEMRRMVEAAAACVRHSAGRRPKMSQVARALESDSAISDLNQGLRPGHSSNYGSADYDTSQYNANIKRFRKLALGSQEYGSEYSGPTSEYGLNASATSSEALSSREIDRHRTDTNSSEMIRHGSDKFNEL